ncbi:WD40 repeat domain-containing protein [Oscillochloris sp. ZM17-4]|uniref:WD40 repeat domain-containing protein n=1 Tax=Oscillochloris sp. ZM17-4 TaxID=2866714 RepID=UPI001C72F014|nr:WD40 repeat domain-containing protein [Oscillochloris sp. ZM17-4]MBX0327007.1 WD40 repeat domain-containing protein [Oscillochloris sp. ZM17-4]
MSNRTGAPLRVVIGCAPEDVPAARAIVQRLRVDGQLPWLMADELAGRPGMLRTLRAAVADADAVIFCLSRRSAGPDGQPVADMARLIDVVRLGRPPVGLVIALRLGVCDMPDALAAATAIELFGYSGYERLLATLRDHAEALRRAAAPPPAPEPPAAPVIPALGLRGRYALAALERQGQAGRLGRGSARGVIMLAADRALLVSGGGVALIDIGDPRPLWSIDCPARRAALSASGRLLAIAGGAQIFIWDLQDGSMRSQISGHGGIIRALAFSPDERSLASASDDRSVRLWRCGDDVASLASPLLASIPAHPDQVASVAFSPDGALLATGGADRTVRIWRTLDRTLVQTLSGHGGAVEALAFSASGDMLAAGSRGRSLRIWAARGWRLLHSIDGHGGAVECLAFSPDGSLIASGAADRATRIWQLSDGTLRRTLGGHSGPVVGVSFSPEGDQVATLGEDDRLLIWRVADGGEVAALRPLSGRVTGLAFSPDGGRLAVGGGDGAVTIHQLYEAAAPLSHHIDHRGAVGSLAFAEDGGRLITAAVDRTVRSYPLGGGEGAILLQTHGATQSATVAPGGRLMASSDGEGTVQIWQLGAQGGQFWRVLRGLRGRPRVLRFSPRAEALAVAAEGGSVQIWRLSVLDGEQSGPQMTIAGVAGRVRSLAFSDDGASLATGAETGHVQIWQVASGALHASLAGPGPAVVGLTFAPDGRSLAGGDASGQVQIWKIAGPARGKSSSRRREPGPISGHAGHAGSVDHLAYSPAGDILASGSSDGTVRLWRV